MSLIEHAAVIGAGLLTISCGPDFTTSGQPVQPKEREKSIVLIKPESSPTPPSEPGKKVVFGTPEPTPPSLRLQDFKNYLKYPTFISIHGESFESFMEQKGYRIDPYQSPIPYRGTVVPLEGLTTHLLPTTDSKIKGLGGKYSLKHGLIPDSLKYFVKVIKEDRTREELWVARLLKVKMGDNPPFFTLVFNTVKFKEGGSGKTETYINLEESIPHLK